jgi:hypothetical protein
LRRRAEDVFDWGYAGDGLFGENAELQGESAREFSFEVDGAAAHAGDDAGVLHLRAFELDKDDGLLRPKEIGHDADDFEVELFNLVASKNGAGVALHAGADLVKREDFAGIGGSSLGKRW